MCFFLTFDRIQDTQANSKQTDYSLEQEEIYGCEDKVQIKGNIDRVGARSMFLRW